MHQKLTKKLFKLFTGELTATIMFGGVWLLFYVCMNGQVHT